MRRRGECGETLVETLVSTALLGIIGIGIIGAIASVIVSTDIDRRLSRGETVLRSYVAAIQDAPYATDGRYSPGFVVPTGYRATVTGVQCWDGNRPAAVPAGSVTLAFGSCGVDHGLQKISVRVESGAGNRATALAATFVKRGPVVPAAST